MTRDAAKHLIAHNNNTTNNKFKMPVQRFGNADQCFSTRTSFKALLIILVIRESFCDKELCCDTKRRYGYLQDEPNNTQF
jgi:hypothetical protein